MSIITYILTGPTKMAFFFVSFLYFLGLLPSSGSWLIFPRHYVVLLHSLPWKLWCLHLFFTLNNDARHVSCKSFGASLTKLHPFSGRNLVRCITGILPLIFNNSANAPSIRESRFISEGIQRNDFCSAHRIYHIFCLLFCGFLALLAPFEKWNPGTIFIFHFLPRAFSGFVSYRKFSFNFFSFYFPPLPLLPHHLLSSFSHSRTQHMIQGRSIQFSSE